MWLDPGRGGAEDADPGSGGRIPSESWAEAGGAAAGEARGGHGGAAMRGGERWGEGGRKEMEEEKAEAAT